MLWGCCNCRDNLLIWICVLVYYVRSLVIPMVAICVYTVHCTVVIVQSKNATFMSSIFAAGLPWHHIYPLCSSHHPLYIFTAVNHQEQQGINAMKTQFTVGSQIYLTWFCFRKHWLKMLILTYLNKFSFPLISNQRAGGNVSEFGQIPPPLCG